MPEPRHYTKLNPNRPNLLAHNAAIASAMKWPLLPWQEYALAGATEIDPETGTFYYSRVLISVQRQAGKTTIDATNSIQNGMMSPGRQLWYTAQTGTHARDKFRDMIDTLEKSPIGGLGTGIAKKYLRGNGSELCRFVNGSDWRPFAPTPESLHSKQADKVTIDEAWAFTDLQGKALLQATVAPFTSRRKLTGHRPQTWIPSAEGTIESTWFNQLIDAERADPSERTFLLDFGIPEDVDPNDLKTLMTYHPGYKHLFEMSDLEGFRTEFKGDIEGFARAYGNRRTGSGERVISAALWQDGRTDASIPEGAPVCVAAASGMDDADAAITMSGYHPEYGKITEIITGGHREGSQWALLRLKELQANAGHAVPVVIPSRGPSAYLHDQARRAGIPLVEDANDTAYAVACPAVLTGLETGEWRYRTHPALEAAAPLAARRWVQDGAWVWGRRASVGSIAALEAATWSSWGIDHLPEIREMQFF